jgi:hypothetical protein
MKKYKLLRDLPWYKKWDELNWFEELRTSKDYLIKEWYLEEIKEKPKYKIWDYVVFDWEDKRYIKIIDIMYKHNGFRYNTGWMGNYFAEHTLRLPTKGELEIYFR